MLSTQTVQSSQRKNSKNCIHYICYSQIMKNVQSLLYSFSNSHLNLNHQVHFLSFLNRAVYAEVLGFRFRSRWEIGASPLPVKGVMALKERGGGILHEQLYFYKGSLIFLFVNKKVSLNIFSKVPQLLNRMDGPVFVRYTTFKRFFSWYKIFFKVSTSFDKDKCISFLKYLHQDTYF